MICTQVRALYVFHHTWIHMTGMSYWTPHVALWHNVGDSFTACFIAGCGNTDEMWQDSCQLFQKAFALTVCMFVYLTHICRHMLCICRCNANLWFCFEEIHYTHIWKKKSLKKKSISPQLHKVENVSSETHTHVLARTQTHSSTQHVRWAMHIFWKSQWVFNFAVFCPGAHIRNLDHNQEA